MRYGKLLDQKKKVKKIPRCVNCGSWYEVKQDKPHWPDYCDRCKYVLKKARNVEKLFKFLTPLGRVNGSNDYKQ